MAVYLFSGGQDSTVALAAGLHRGDRSPCAFTIDYGQRNSNELSAASFIAEGLFHKFGVTGRHVFIQMRDAVRQVWDQCALTSCHRRVTPRSAFVPGRNAVFLSVAASFAASHVSYGRRVVCGTTAIDAGGSADGSIRFCRQFAAAFNAGLPRGRRVRFDFPLKKCSKGDILRRAHALGILEFVVDTCVSCHNGSRDRHSWGHGCGRCSACLWRKVGWREYRGLIPRTIR